MANDNNNINELVINDDDPTAELEVLTPSTALAEVETEAAAKTAGFSNGAEENRRRATLAELELDLQSRSETVDRLQYDIAQLRARWLGLETEIRAREQLTDTLNKELHELRDTLKGKQDLVRQRDGKIKSLKAEIRERNSAYLLLDTELDSLRRQLASLGDATGDDGQNVLAVQAGQLASSVMQLKDLREQLIRSEEYADKLRQKLLDREAEYDDALHAQQHLQHSLDDAQHRIASLQAALADAEGNSRRLSDLVAQLHTMHADEIRTIRFELGQAQETVSQHELINEQLASDLVETRSYRVELESMLSASEESKRKQIEALEKDNRGLRQKLDDAQQKIETKSQAINCLLTELAKKSQAIESAGTVQEVIHDIDERKSGPIEERVERDRITRVLVGTVDGKELRFPLFKDRLTIGRTQQNDIQLAASYVSRRHAVVVTDGLATRVIDWGSKNGVFVNSRRITEHFLKNGDIMTVGTAEFRYEERPKRDP